METKEEDEKKPIWLVWSIELVEGSQFTIPYLSAVTTSKSRAIMYSKLIREKNSIFTTGYAYSKVLRVEIEERVVNHLYGASMDMVNKLIDFKEG